MLQRINKRQVTSGVVANSEADYPVTELDEGRVRDVELRQARGRQHWLRSRIWRRRKGWIYDNGHWSLIVAVLWGVATTGTLSGLIASTGAVMVIAILLLCAMAWRENYHVHMSQFYGYMNTEDRKAPD